MRGKGRGENEGEWRELMRGTDRRGRERRGRKEG